VTRLARKFAPRLIGALSRMSFDSHFLSLTHSSSHSAHTQHTHTLPHTVAMPISKKDRVCRRLHPPRSAPTNRPLRFSASTRPPIRLAPARPSRRTACPSRPRSPPLLYAFQRRIRGQVTWLTYCSARTAAARSSTPTKCSSRRTPRATTATGPRRGVGPTTSNECRAEDAERAGHGPLCWNDTGGSTMRMAPR
jgi:hypothetical protein